jgi:hypothetical protein
VSRCRYLFVATWSPSSSSGNAGPLWSKKGKKKEGKAGRTIRLSALGAWGNKVLSGNSYVDGLFPQHLSARISFHFISVLI